MTFSLFLPLNCGPSLCHNGLQDWRRRGGFDIVRRMKEPAITWDACFLTGAKVSRAPQLPILRPRERRRRREGVTPLRCEKLCLRDALTTGSLTDCRSSLLFLEEVQLHWQTNERKNGRKESTVCSAWKWKWNKQFGRLAESTGSRSYRNRLDGEHGGVQVSISFYFRRESEPGTAVQEHVRRWFMFA